MIVIDASAALELLLRTGAGKNVEARVFQRGESLSAPHLIDVEIAQVLRRYSRSGQVSSQRCSEALDDWRALRLHRYEHEPFLAHIWALRDNLTAYDAAYVTLAAALDAPLVTCDARIASAPGHGARVELVQIAP